MLLPASLPTGQSTRLSGAHALPSRSTVALHQPAALSSTAARSCSAVSRRRWCFERRRRHCCSLVAPVRESAIFLASRLFSSPANEANSLSFADGCCCATVDETSQKIWPAALQRRCASALTILPALLMARERHASRARPRAACQGREEEHGRRAGVRTHSNGWRRRSAKPKVQSVRYESDFLPISRFCHTFRRFGCDEPAVSPPKT